MDNSTNQKTNNSSSSKWVDNLLIKDESGKLSYLNKDHPRPKPEKKESSPAVSEGVAAPKDDTFAPIQYIKGTSKSPAEFAFHPEDQKEIEEIGQKMYADDSKKYGIEKIVDRIISKQNLKLSIDKKDLFTNVLYDFFRSRKNAVVTREVLANNIKLSATAIDSVVSVIKSIKAKIDADGGLVVKMSELKAEQPVKPVELPKPPVEIKKPELPKVEPKPIEEKPPEPPKIEPKPEQVKPVEKSKPDPAFAMPSKDQKSESKSATEDDETKSIPVKTVKKSEPPKIEPKPEPKKEEPKPEQVKPVEKEEKSSLPKVMRPSSPAQDKKQISDVVTPKKEEPKKQPSRVLTGPVQEIQNIDLVAWRRMGEHAQERADKVLDKINLLEQESYTKKAQGIKAWRESKLYEFYLQLGAESMVNGQEVSALIDQYTKEGKDTLAHDDFEAISDLNKKIRF